MSQQQGARPGPVQVEVCVESVESALAAQAGGAHRVELCANLFEGGTTPSAGMIRLTRAQIQIGLFVMIRPRGGDFCYTPLEFEVMRQDIALAKELGADGIVLGILHPDGTIDEDRTAALMEEAAPLPVTFHRAFDLTPDASAALETLIRLGVPRVLTSGQESSALEGSELLAQLVQQAAGRIGIMAGGGITERNVRRIVSLTGVQEIHLSGRSAVAAPVQVTNSRVHMGGALHPPETIRLVTDRARIQACVAQLTDPATP
ncbi:copper homeostasis protein CutC [Litorilinea aerophila]|uniref:PF03932 family protein CutC n=1 Tax=Litorilinea aerophila TaxID=1204385 RepID=A0A540VJ42_9CHLR|nr:copper homeostasis protein CutC [Litorilinea aerophila]MCC9075640.1 copper homeostasis protein CutC [Litorilinea aerophila]GIV79153.1 MAG: copper homeostasis protein CutC [Litorilinea sp.]